MYSILRYFLFLFNAETAHYIAMNSLRTICFIPFVKQILHAIYFRKNPIQAFGIHFPNQVGLAAGFDKNAQYVDVLEAIGFGHIEVGTVTPKPQAGNDKPRLFRLPKDQAIINRMGFNNDGADIISERLLKYKNRRIVLGGNIGKNKITPNEDAHLDYLYCFQKMYDVVDYFVVNVSSPNTPNLRELQEKDSLTKIFSTLFEERNTKKIKKPILLKIAPDLTHNQLDEIASLVNELSIDGLITTNTTISRANLFTEKEMIEAIGAGGLSGKPVLEKSTEVLSYLSSKIQVPIIGVGGIFSADDALLKNNAGASLVQLYTGFIYRGISLVKEISEMEKWKI